MGRNILFLSVLCLLIFETTAVNMCTNQSASSKDVSLSLVSGTGVSGCNCSVKFTKTDNIGSVKSKIELKTVKFSGCKYNLVISHDNTNYRIGCSNTIVFYETNKSDEIQIYLESNVNSQDESTTFEVTITSTLTVYGALISLVCNRTIKKPTKTTTSVTEAVTTTETTTSTVTTTSLGPSLLSTLSSTSNSTHKSTEKSTEAPTSNSTHKSTDKSTIAPTSNSTHKSTDKSTITSTPGKFTYTVTQISNKPTTGNTINEKKTGGVTNPGGDDIDIGIIGGAVGGGLLLIILIIIIIIICVVKKRKKNHEKRDYNRPTVTRPQHGYTDIDLVAKGNNSSRQSDNMDQKANSPVVMEIIENDLYVSSDDIMDLKSRDNNNTNQKTDAIDSKSCDNNNTNQKTDANNGPAENSTSHDNGGPLYAVVNKKPYSLKSDQTDKSNGIAGVTDIDLGTKDNNSSSRQSDNTEQNTNSSVAIKMDPKSRDDNNTNQKTDAMDSKLCDNNNTNSHDNDGPLYSSVNKKPKSPISNQTDNSNGITGEDHDTLL